MSSSASTSRPLSRGAACLPCRKLKAKCDGNRPACGRCIANNRPDDCEYATGAEVTRSRLLEENIALLEARIRELENPGEGTPSVQLHDPRRQASASAGPSTTRPSSLGPIVPLYPANMAQPAASIPDPTPQEIQVLVQSFMTHASQLGFFLNPTRFRQRIRGPVSAGDALMSAVFLWGSKLSNSNTLRSREAYFVDRATQTVAGTTTIPARPNDVLHTIQAEVLLANYFFSTGRLLEGRYHCLAAVALVTGSRLHQLNVNTMGNDPIAAGEKIQAFWTVGNMDKVWASAMNSPASICQFGRANMQVSTPWPLATQAYEQGLLTPRVGGNYSMEDFIRGVVDDSHEDFSPLSIRAKAGVLYYRAIYVSSLYRVDMPDQNDFLNRFNALDNLIERFHRQLAAIRNRGPDDMRELLVSRTFLCAAGIQLHSTFASQQAISWQKTISMAVAAGRVVEIVDINQYRHLDPIMAIIWSSICKVLVGELRRVRQNAVPVRQGDPASVTSSLDRIMTAMTTLASNSTLMDTHLAEIQQARGALN